MAGSLPGVESARRRRFHGASVWSDSSSFINSGFASTRPRLSFDTHLSSTSFLQRSMLNQSDEDDNLGGVAREAKERLDGRLRGHWKSEIKRHNSQERLRGASVVEEHGRRPMVMGDLQMEVFGLKKSGSKRFSWGKMGLSWKSLEQDECVVCLDQFKAGEKLSRLPCAHRFHSKCLFPWLENNAHCPCCRKGIMATN